MDRRQIVASRLEAAQKSSGLKDHDVAREIGVARTTYIGWRQGDHSPDYEQLAQLAKLFSVSISYLLGETNLAEQAQKILEREAIPVVPIPILGTIHAGDPIPAEEEIIGWTAIPEHQAKGGEYFALRVRGNCFQAGRRPIYEGDVVVVRKQDVVEDGEIAVVVWPDSEDAQLRRIYRQDGSVILHADNPDYPPEVVRKRQLNVLGAVVGIQSTPTIAKED